MFVKKGIIIPIGGVGEVDNPRVYYPSMLKVNDKIYCYYAAHDGTNQRIALAISEDGMNFTKKGVVIPLGGAGEVDDERTYYPCALFFNGKIHCYYTPVDGISAKIALATSEDGMNFTKKGVVIPLGGAVDMDSVGAYSPSVMEHNDKIYCYFTAQDAANSRVALATSEDGMNFTKKGVVIPIGGAGEVDSSRAYHPSMLKVNDKIYCYFTAHDGTNQRIALAISEDGMNFTKKGVVIPLGGAGEVDDERVYTPNVLKVNDKIYCYYTAYNGAYRGIALAISEDGM